MIMEQTVNTMTITLEEYKRMIDENSNLHAKLAVKDETIKSLYKEIGTLETTNTNLEQKINEKRVIVYVNNLPRDTFSTRSYSNGISLSADSPELVEIIKTSMDVAMTATIKEYEKTIENLKDELERANKMARSNRLEVNEKHDAKVKELNKEIETLTQDYNDLKLDKAANIIESERLAEVIKLKETIAELEAKKDAKEFEPWIENRFARKFFKNIILRAARDIADTEEYRLDQKKRRIKEDVTSPIGKAKDYLKTLNSYGNEIRRSKSEVNMQYATTSSYGISCTQW